MKAVKVLSLLFLLAFGGEAVFALPKRARQEGLAQVVSPHTVGKDGLYLAFFGRTFLWDNDAARRLPPLLPHAEGEYGLTGWLDLAAGFNAMSYVMQPGSLYLRLKAMVPDAGGIPFWKIGGEVELRRNLLDDFPSNGYRAGNEGFGPEGFLFGNGDAVTSYRMTAAVDIDLIRITSYLPFKAYANLGYAFGLSSNLQEENRRLAEVRGPRPGLDDFSLLPLGLGLELKTYGSDYFAELFYEPFAKSVFAKASALASGRSGGDEVRYRAVGKSFDIHLLEMPLYLSGGARLKYDNGLSLKGGFSWLLSAERGARLGGCSPSLNPCRDEGASDGFSPFYPQWKVFGRLQYPLRFVQTAGELYRTFLLKRYRTAPTVLDVEKSLREGPRAEEAAEDEDEARRRQLEERRKEADAKDILLN